MAESSPMSRRGNPLKRSHLASDADRWMYDPGVRLHRIDWADVFGRTAPVELEIGCGKGLFLLGAAAADPETDFVGVEVARTYALATAGRLAKRALTNARVISMDARVLLAHYVADACLRRLHVLFPDPWWKKRHKKRRVFTPEFVAQCERVLVPGGEVNVATDVADYFHDIQALFAPHTRLQPRDVSPPGEPTHDMDYLTHYERRTRMAGDPVFRIRYVLTDRPVAVT